MARISRWAGYGLGALFVIALVAFAAVWLTSSARGPAEIRELDGVALGPSAETPRVAKLLGFPT